jgi:hypothetical protein
LDALARRPAIHQIHPPRTPRHPTIPEKSMRAALVLAFTAAVIATPAHAQLGALRKKAEKAVANKVDPKATTGTRRTPAFDDVVIELTDARVKQLLTGFAAEARVAETNRQNEAGRAEAEAAYQRKRQQFERDYAEWEKKNDTWFTCTQKYRDELNRRGEKAAEYVQNIDTVAFNKVTARIKAAQEKGDMKEAMRLADSISSSMTKATSQYSQTDDIETRSKAECGDQPEEPKAPMAPSTQTMSTLGDGARASGIPEERYRIARERILAWLSLGDEKITKGETQYAFTDAELAALGARKGELSKYQTVLQTY